MYFIVATQSYNSLPEQCEASPAKPGLHVQVWEPKVLAQLAFLSHLCVPVLHSSISEDEYVCGILADCGHSPISCDIDCLRCVTLYGSLHFVFSNMFSTVFDDFVKYIHIWSI